MRHVWLWITGAVVAIACGSASAQQKPAPATKFSDEAVDAAMKRGIEFLYKAQQPDGAWEPYGEPTNPKYEKDAAGVSRQVGVSENKNYHKIGPMSLVVYAMIEAGESPKDKRVEKALQVLAAESGIDRTYSVALRANAYLAAIRNGQTPLRAALRRDVDRLIRSANATGGYDYYARGVPDNNAWAWDNSNSNYGLLGVWAGSRAGLEIPRAYWELIAKFWRSHQKQDGSWDYTDGKKNTHAAMCAAAVASLFVCYDAVNAQKFVGCDLNVDADPDYQAIKKGLDWFDKNFSTTMDMTIVDVQRPDGKTGRQPRSKSLLDFSDMFYYLYNIERVGLASGYKYFGTEDWYKSGVAFLLSSQQGDGSWRGSWGNDVATAFALLFLNRGRSPVLMNKLEYSGDWNCRPRDLAALTEWMTSTKTFERMVNWQIVNLRVPAEDLHDAPILYISGSKKKPTFTDEEVEKLRRYVNEGGTLFSVTECNGAPFKQGMLDLYKKLFPKYELTKCTPDHDIYGVQFKGLSGYPAVSIITNGVRPLVIHTDADLALSWQLQRFATDKRSFEFAANMFLYVTDYTFRNRGVHVWPTGDPGKTTKQVKIVRLKHSGDFDPEPLAYERFAWLMANKTQTKVEVVAPVAISELAAQKARLAVMTGTGELKLTDAELETLREFIENGGTLLVDAAGGSKEFAQSAETLIRKIMPGSQLVQLQKDHPLFSVTGNVIEKLQYRRRTASRKNSLQAIVMNQRPVVIFSDIDITGGLVGEPAFQCDGYAPETAFELMRNIVIYANSATAAGTEATTTKGS